MRWLLLLILAGVTLFFAIRYRRELVAWVRDFIAMVKGWFLRDQGSTDTAQPDGSGQPQLLPVRFSDLSDPFLTYAGDPDRTVKALFDAACVWGREHRVERREDETPEEFVGRLGRKYSPVAETLARLGMVYSRLAYAQKRVSPNDAQAMRSLWDWMVQHPSRNPSGGVILERDRNPGSAV